MKNINKSLLLVLFVFIAIISCRNDDDGLTVVPEADRGEQQIIDNDSIIEFLNSHYYNAAFFVGNTSATLDDIEITELPKDEDGEYLDLPDPEINTLLIDAVETRTTMFEDADYEYYVLKLNEGGGTEQPNYCDNVRGIFNGFLLDGEVFDSAVTPVSFDLLATIRGWQLVFPEFKVSQTKVTNGDGTVDYINNGLGMMFLPSGLAYFSEPPGGSIIPVYAPLIFKFELYETEVNDHDNDNVPSILEDLNNNFDPRDDDTDEDEIFDTFDIDDDGDGTLTIDEDLEDMDLTVDTDGDGDPTNDKDGDGDPTNDDTDQDGIPNYLDTDDTDARIDTNI